MHQPTNTTYVIGTKINGLFNVLSYFQPDVPYVFSRLNDGEKLTKDFLKENEVYFCNTYENAERRRADAQKDLTEQAVASLKISFDEVKARFPHFERLRIYTVDSSGEYQEAVKKPEKKKQGNEIGTRRYRDMGLDLED